MKHQNLIYKLILAKPLEVLIMATTKEKSVDEKEKVFTLLTAISVYLDLCKNSPELWDWNQTISLTQTNHVKFSQGKNSLPHTTLYDFCSYYFIGSEKKFYQMLLIVSQTMRWICDEKVMITDIIEGYATMKKDFSTDHKNYIKQLLNKKKEQYRKYIWN